MDFHHRCPAPGHYDPALLEQHIEKARALWPMMQTAVPTGTAASLLLALTWSQSRFNPQFSDQDGRQGLLGLFPDEARLLLPEGHGLTPDLFHPETSVFIGGRYLDILLRIFDCDALSVLFAFRVGLRTMRAQAKTLRVDADMIRYARDTLMTLSWLSSHDVGRCPSDVSLHLN